MAKEFKSIDVESDIVDIYVNLYYRFGWQLIGSQRVYNRSTRPVGMISYEGFTYVHSQTDVLDFTRLSFERDTQMPDYDEIAELEAEYFYYSSRITAARPHPPFPLRDWKTWVKEENPKMTNAFLSLISGALVMVACWLMYFLVAFIIYVTMYSPDSTASIILMAGAAILFVFASLIMPFVVVKLIQKRKIKKILSQNTLNHPRLKAEYEHYCDCYYYQMKRIDEYDRAVVRMNEILDEVYDIIN